MQQIIKNLREKIKNNFIKVLTKLYMYGRINKVDFRESRIQLKIENKFGFALKFQYHKDM